MARGHFLALRPWLKSEDPAMRLYDP